MIDYETILSTTEDKLTLLQWLKKVEAALKDASATTFKVNKKGDATLTFSIEFADGSELESGEIILQQGESVQSAAIVNGHLILTLTNGDELDAGDLGGVTSFSIDASQHLIVHYQNGTTQDLGAIFSGNVNIAGNLTADSIIENMTGYSFTPSAASPNYDIEYIYVGACKNGNKLTFVFAFNLTPHTTINSVSVGYIGMPASIGQKLYPTLIGGVKFLTLDKKYVTSSASAASFKEVIFAIQKASDGYSGLSMASTDNLVAETKYYCRYEVTFLLGESL